ncbi:hypothetical protein [Afipia massiliensis]|uniref:hypothetical protein n=1 Tax=Afipia massiliensis TaxID=211460 RepID=UPI001FF03D01|nr:hypothetical protein [Afipia massiliensis]
MSNALSPSRTACNDEQLVPPPVPTRELACSRCGAINRIGAYGVTKLPHCGKCQSALPETLVKRVLRQAHTRRYLITIAVGLGLLAILKPSALTGWVPDGSPTQTAAPPAACTGYPQPSSGLYASYDHSARVSPLTIRTSPGGYYFIKLENAVTSQPIMAFYMRGGETLEQDVPEGSFVLKYAAGDIWCGPTALFGQTTSTNRVDRIFEFTETRGYTVELISRKGGNLKTRSIEPSQF